MDGFLTATFFSLIGSISSWSQILYTHLMEDFHFLAMAIVILYISISGILIMLGKFKDPKEVLLSILMIVFIYNLARNPDTYGEWVVNPIVSTTNSIASYVATSGDGEGIISLFYKLESVVNKMANFAEMKRPDGNILTDTWLYIQSIAAILPLTAMFFATAVMFLALIVLSYFCLFMLATAGGICLFFASFQKTRHIASAWLKAVINHSLTIVFTSAALSISLFGLEESLDILAQAGPDTGVFSAQWLMTLVWCAISIILLLKSPDLAASLSGGMAGSTSWIVAATSAGAGYVYSNALKGSVLGRDSQGNLSLAHGRAAQAGKLGISGAKHIHRAYSATKGIGGRNA